MTYPELRITNYELRTTIMENDYLWDKTGEDKEIEQLESALKFFRYQPTFAPILPVKVLQVEEKPRFSFFTNFRLAMTGFACLAILLVGVGIFLRFSKDKVVNVADLSKPIVAPINLENIDKQIISDPIIKPPPISQTIVRKINQRKVSNTKPTNLVFRQATPKVKSNKLIKLTAEEKDAFEKLMLALSITGETLKEVKDKANSIEEKTAIK